MIDLSGLNRRGGRAATTAASNETFVKMEEIALFVEPILLLLSTFFSSALQLKKVNVIFRHSD